MPVPHRYPQVNSHTLGDGYVVVEPTSQTAHALEGLAAAVWSWANDGPAPDAHSGDVQAVITQLTALGLLEASGSSPRRRRAHQPRLLVPGLGITSIVLPSPCAAMSPGFQYTVRRTTGPAEDAVDG